MDKMAANHKAVFGDKVGTLVMIDHATMVPSVYSNAAGGTPTQCVGLLTAFYASFDIMLGTLSSATGIPEDRLRAAVMEIGWPAFQSKVESNGLVLPIADPKEGDPA